LLLHTRAPSANAAVAAAKKLSVGFGEVAVECDEAKDVLDDQGADAILTRWRKERSMR